MDDCIVNVKEAEGTAKYGSWSMTVEVFSGHFAEVMEHRGL